MSSRDKHTNDDDDSVDASEPNRTALLSAGGHAILTSLRYAIRLN